MNRIYACLTLILTVVLTLVSGGVDAAPSSRVSWRNPQTGITWVYRVKDKNEAVLCGIKREDPPTGELRLPSTVGQEEFVVTEIAYGAFNGLENVTGITVPASVKTIGNGRRDFGNVCQRCESLTFIRVDAANAHYASDGVALYDKNMRNLYAVPAGLKSFSVPEGVETICCLAFGCRSGKCGKLESVSVSKSVCKIDAYAFSGCKDLREVRMPATGVKEIGFAAFAGCESLESFDIPASVTNLSNACIVGCPNLKSIKFLGMVPPPLTAKDKCNVTFAGLNPSCEALVPKAAAGDWSTLEKLGLKIRRY